MSRKARTREVKREDKSIEYLHSRYCYEERRALYIANEETNQVHDGGDIPDFIERWNNGETPESMMEWFGMDEWEFRLLVIDLLQKKRIEGDLIVRIPSRAKDNAQKREEEQKGSGRIR